MTWINKAEKVSMNAKTTTVLKVISNVSLVLLLVITVVTVPTQIRSIPDPFGPLNILQPLCILSFIMCQLVIRFGSTHSLAFIISTVLLSYLYEQILISFGLLSWTCSGRNCLKIGDVDATSPFSWFVIVYFSTFLADIILFFPASLFLDVVPNDDSGEPNSRTPLVSSVSSVVTEPNSSSTTTTPPNHILSIKQSLGNVEKAWSSRRTVYLTFIACSAVIGAVFLLVYEPVLTANAIISYGYDTPPESSSTSLYYYIPPTFLIYWSLGVAAFSSLLLLIRDYLDVVDSLSPFTLRQYIYHLLLLTSQTILFSSVTPIPGFSIIPLATLGSLIVISSFRILSHASAYPSVISLKDVPSRRSPSSSTKSSSAIITLR